MRGTASFTNTTTTAGRTLTDNKDVVVVQLENRITASTLSALTMVLSEDDADRIPASGGTKSTAYEAIKTASLTMKNTYSSGEHTGVTTNVASDPLFTVQ